MAPCYLLLLGSPGRLPKAQHGLCSRDQRALPGRILTRLRALQRQPLLGLSLHPTEYLPSPPYASYNPFYRAFFSRYPLSVLFPFFTLFLLILILI